MPIIIGGCFQKGGSMKEKERIYKIALNEVMQLGLDDYHTVFLALMVSRKIRHPQEHCDEISQKVMEKMPQVFKKKKYLIPISVNKTLDDLEELLEKHATTEMLECGGENVSSVVKFFTRLVFDKLNA